MKDEAIRTTDLAWAYDVSEIDTSVRARADAEGSGARQPPREPRYAKLWCVFWDEDTNRPRGEWV